MRWKDMQPYAGRVIGLSLGFIFGIIYLIFGFWKAIVFSLIVLIGFYFGNKSDRKEEWIRPSWKTWMAETVYRIKERWEQYKENRNRTKWR